MRGVSSTPLPALTDSPETRPREIPEMTDNDTLTEENDTLTKFAISFEPECGKFRDYSKIIS